MVRRLESADNFSMAGNIRSRFKGAKQPKMFLKEWRRYRGLTQEALAERVDMSVSNVSQLERGIQGYSLEGLARLADALGCEPGHLLMVDPIKDDAIWSIWEQAKEVEKKEILGFAKGLVRRTG